MDIAPITIHIVSRVTLHLAHHMAHQFQRGHQCRKCGRIIYGRYNYCPDCARKKGFFKEDY